MKAINHNKVVLLLWNQKKMLLTILKEVANAAAWAGMIAAAKEAARLLENK